MIKKSTVIIYKRINFKCSLTFGLIRCQTLNTASGLRSVFNSIFLCEAKKNQPTAFFSITHNNTDDRLNNGKKFK